MSPHPTPERLNLWLEGRLPETESQAIEAHLGTCPEVCPAVLERLTGKITVSRPGSAPGGDKGPPSPPGYEILGEIRRGGMGVVYRARQVGLGREVALKMLLGGEYAEPDQLARFRLEAEAVALLRHPHIVQIYEVGRWQGQPFFSMELMDGSLADRLQVGPLPPREAAGMVEVLARTMHAVHQRGLLHRDL